jgi:hypothetical protein
MRLRDQCCRACNNEPVLHWDTVVTVGAGGFAVTVWVAVAAAARKETTASLENILENALFSSK